MTHMKAAQPQTTVFIPDCPNTSIRNCSILEKGSLKNLVRCDQDNKNGRIWFQKQKLNKIRCRRYWNRITATVTGKTSYYLCIRSHTTIKPSNASSSSIHTGKKHESKIQQQHNRQKNYSS